MDVKICTKCRAEKSVSEFSSHKPGKDGLRSQCRSCVRAYQLARYYARKQEARPLTADTQRTCLGCGNTQSIDQFNKQQEGKGGRRSQCRTCVTAYRQKLNVEYKANYALPTSGLKWCKQCKRERLVSEFHANKNAKNGLQSYCKTCCRKRNREFKIEILSHYCDGELRCACCGETELDFLTLDHVNNDGAEHRRQLGAAGVSVYCWIKRNKFPTGFAILCWNCNAAKGRFGICPHQRKRDEKIE